MTAISIIRQRDRVSLVTDGLIHGGKGVMSKVYTLPHLNLAIASTGAAGAGIVIAAEANQATSYDDLKENIGDVMQHCEREHGRQMRTKENPDYELYITGIGETGPDFFYAVNHRRRPGVEPYKAISSEGSAQFQPCTQEIWAEISEGWHGRIVDDLNLMVEAPRIIEIQRRHLNDQYRDQIGGACTVTTIDRDGITQRVAKRWPLHLNWEAAECH